ncbi:MAG: hypothetical protein ACLT1W_09965 [Alistipes onderdonkii]
MTTSIPDRQGGCAGSRPGSPDKKYDYIKQIAGTTLDEQLPASVPSRDFDSVTFGAFYVNGPVSSPSGRRHRFDDRERRPVGSGEGHVGGLCFPGG